MLDLGPATTQLGALIRELDDAQLDDPTPCTDYALGDLLSHLEDMSVAFTQAARKETGPGAEGGPRPGDAARLERGWRERLPALLAGLAAAWRDPAAWTGMTRAGGVELPGEIGGQVAMNEVVTHGWDVARAAGRPRHVDEASVAGATAFVALFSGDGSAADRGDAFGPEIPVTAEASGLDRLIGMTGRDPGWARPA